MYVKTMIKVKLRKTLQNSRNNFLFCNSGLIRNCTITSAVFWFDRKSSSSSFTEASVDARGAARLLPAKNSPGYICSLGVVVL